MKEFATLREAIDSWYANKAIPSIVVLLMSGIKIAGLLRDYTDSEIIVEIAGTKERQSILIPDVEQVELIWDGSAISMGELDGTGMEGVSLPGAQWRHKITRNDGGAWLFQEVSKSASTPYQGPQYRAQ